MFRVLVALIGALVIYILITAGVPRIGLRPSLEDLAIIGAAFLLMDLYLLPPED